MGWRSLPGRAERSMLVDRGNCRQRLHLFPSHLGAQVRQRAYAGCGLDTRSVVTNPDPVLVRRSRPVRLS